jgi:hypothetical protein
MDQPQVALFRRSPEGISIVSTTQTRTQTAQVSCVNKPNRYSTEEAITHIGGPGWKITVPDAIRKIENYEWTFYTLVGGKRAEVDVRTSASGRKYLQTKADGYWNNNLLALAECP